MVKVVSILPPEIPRKHVRSYPSITRRTEVGARQVTVPLDYPGPMTSSGIPPNARGDPLVPVMYHSDRLQTKLGKGPRDIAHPERRR